MSGGGALGLGKSKSDSSSYGESFTDSYGSSASVSEDTSRSSGSSISQGSSRTTQSVFAAEVFRKLFGGASAAADTALAASGELDTVANQLFTGGTQFFEGLGGDAGTSYLEDRLSADNPALEQQIDLLREDTGRLFREELNPAIVSNAVAGGTLGGGRQGVAQGLAMETAAREFTRGAAALRSDDLGRRDAAAATIAGNSISAANTGLGALPMLLDSATSSATTELGILERLAAVIGGPTVLSDSVAQDYSTSTSQSAADAFSRSYGENRSTSSATNTSTGRSRGWNFNMSGYGGVMAGSGGGG